MTILTILYNYLSTISRTAFNSLTLVNLFLLSFITYLYSNIHNIPTYLLIIMLMLFAAEHAYYFYSEYTYLYNTTLLSTGTHLLSTIYSFYTTTIRPTYYLYIQYFYPSLLPIFEHPTCLFTPTQLTIFQHYIASHTMSEVALREILLSTLYINNIYLKHHGHKRVIKDLDFKPLSLHSRIPKKLLRPPPT